MRLERILEENEKLRCPSQCDLKRNELVDLIKNRMKEEGGTMQNWMFYLIGDIYNLGFRRGMCYQKRKDL